MESTKAYKYIRFRLSFRLYWWYEKRYWWKLRLPVYACVRMHSWL